MSIDSCWRSQFPLGPRGAICLDQIAWSHSPLYRNIAKINTMAENTLEAIPVYLDQSLLPQHAKQAEQYLRSIESSPGFAINLLHVIDSSNLASSTRLAGALFFKNLIKRKWTNEDGVYLLPNDDVTHIKREIIDIMIRLPNQLQVQIGESISLIAESDFPHNWDNLIDQLIAKLSELDFVLNKGILLVAHLIFKKWRPLFRSDELFLEIKMVLDKFAQPFLSLLTRVDQLIDEGLQKSDKASSQIYFENLLLLVQIYYDLNCQDIPEFFEDNMVQGMSIIHKYLQLVTPLLTDADDDDDIDILIKTKTAILELVLLYVSRYAEEFEPLIESFITTVWTLINSFATKQQKYDLFVVKALSFLTSISKISKYQSFFNSEAALKEIIEKIILPNIYFREIDEEHFEDEPINYVRSDLEGSDFDTRRKSATDFLRELKEVNTELLTNTVMKYVNQFLTHSDWRNKDIAIYLFSSLAAKGNVTNVGVTSTNVLVDVVKFFTDHIAFDLTNDAHPILKTDAIKYIFTFRNQLTKEQLLTTLPLLINHFANPNPVVYTYTAITIDKLLSMTSFSDANHTPVFNKNDIEPFITDLLNSSFKLVLADNLSPERLAENEFLARAIMRVLNTAENSIDGELKVQIVNQLIQILLTIARNPSNPKFTHYVFESLGLLIKYDDAAASPNRITNYIQLVLPPLLQILADDVQEFVPYIFQILAFLLEQLPNDQPLPSDYNNLIKPLMSPVVWEYRGNIPGITRLLVAILEQLPSTFASPDSLTPLLGVFQKLIASKANDSYGFDLLQSIILHLPFEAILSYIGQIAILLLTRLKNSRTDKFIKKFVVFLMSLSCVPLNPELAAKSPSVNASFVVKFIDSAQQGVFQQIYNSFILPTTSTLANLQDKKIAILGVLELVTSDAFQSTYPSLVIPTIETLTKNISSFIGIAASSSTISNTVASGNAAVAITGELDLESASFGSQFSKIVTIQKAAFDPLPNVKNNDETSIKYGAVSNIKKLASLGVLSQLSPEATQVLA